MRTLNSLLKECCVLLILNLFIILLFGNLVGAESNIVVPDNSANPDFNNYYSTFLVDDINGSTLNPQFTLNGTLVNDLGFHPFAGRSALYLKDDSYLKLDDSSSLSWTNEGSVAFWIKLQLTGRWQHVIDKRGFGLANNMHQGYSVAVSNGNALFFTVATSEGIWSTSRYQLDNNWHNVVATWGNDELRLFIDGKQYGGTTNTKGVISSGSDNPLHIGARQAGYGFVSGILDELRIFSKCLSPHEVSLLRSYYYDSTGLVLYLSFDGDISDKSAGHLNFLPMGTKFAWVNGYVNLPVTVTLNDVSVPAICLLYSTNNSFSVYCYSDAFIGKTVVRTTIFNSTQTLNVIIDRLKVTESGLDVSPAFLGKPAVGWFKVVYEADYSEFNSACGKLFINGSSALWSDANGRWEFNFVPIELGNSTFMMTSFLDTKANLLSVNDENTVHSFVVTSRTYPLVWITFPLVIFLSAYFCFIYYKRLKKLENGVAENKS